MNHECYNLRLILTSFIDLLIFILFYFILLHFISLPPSSRCFIPSFFPVQRRHFHVQILCVCVCVCVCVDGETTIEIGADVS